MIALRMSPPECFEHIANASPSISKPSWVLMYCNRAAIVSSASGLNLNLAHRLTMGSMILVA